MRKIGWVTTWNTKCGVATYSKFLKGELDEDSFSNIVFSNRIQLDNLISVSDENNVYRLWDVKGTENYSHLLIAILNQNIEVLIIQYQSSLFNLPSLNKFILNLLEARVEVYVTLHNLLGQSVNAKTVSVSLMKEALLRVNSVFVHRARDKQVLKDMGIDGNVVLFPHGVLNVIVDENHVNYKKKCGLEGKAIVATFGFLFPHKGILETIEALEVLIKKNQNVHFLLLNATYTTGASAIYYKDCINLINQKNLARYITFNNGFLTDNEIISHLSCADLILMPYQNTTESSSAAVRYALSTGKPVLCTPLAIFDDVSDVIHFTKDITASSIAESIDSLLNDSQLLEVKSNVQKSWVSENSWGEVSKVLISFLQKKSKIN